MYCPNCGTEVDNGAAYCRQCGESITDSSDTPDTATESDKPEESTEEWNPKRPITSVFASILLLWVTLDVSNTSAVLMFGLPGLLIIPRIRRYVIREVEERYDTDLTTGRVTRVVAGLYVILLLMALAIVIGSTANSPTVGGSPTSQLAVSLLTVGIMFGAAAAIVTAIRINRKLRG